jgi:hypothetical protein
MSNNSLSLPSRALPPIPASGRAAPSSKPTADQNHREKGRSDEKLHTASIADSAYHSMSSERTFDTQLPTSDQRHSVEEIWIGPIPGSDLLMFRNGRNAAVDRSYLLRQPLLEDCLMQAVRGARQNLHNYATHLEHVGKTLETARPTLLVFCAPQAERTVRDFFRSPDAQQQLRFTDASIKPLEYLVLPQAPKFASADQTVEVICQNYYTERRETYCGAPIMFRSFVGNKPSGASQFATFGGVVKITLGSGETKFLGMSAGHATDMLDDSSCNEANVSLDKASNITDWIPRGSGLGSVLKPDAYPGVTAGRAKQSHDWSLFTVNSPRSNRAYHLNVHGEDATDVASHMVLQAEKPVFHDDVSDPVLLLGATRGTRQGELCSVPTRLWLAQSDKFVDAYLLQVKNGTGE